MAVTVPSHIKKYLTMKSEVKQIFDDLEEYLDYCRLNLLKYDPSDMYKGDQYQVFEKTKKTDKRR
jgi:hypothetical protein